MKGVYTCHSRDWPADKCYKAAWETQALLQDCIKRIKPLPLGGPYLPLFSEVFRGRGLHSTVLGSSCNAGMGDRPLYARSVLEFPRQFDVVRMLEATKDFEAGMIPGFLTESIRLTEKKKLPAGAS